MTTKKKIGIVGWKTSDDSFGIGLAYAEFFSQFGELQIITPTETEARTDLDLLVLPGGPDVNPFNYLGHQPMGFMNGKQCPFRERFDEVLLPKYIIQETPIFGICRGHQALAVDMGGTLTQDMYHETNKYDRDALVHEIEYTKEFRDIAPSLGIELEPIGPSPTKIKVNSIHHQVVDKIPDNAIEICRYKGDDYEATNEALMYTDYPAFTVQWHPEHIYDSLSIQLIQDLLQR